VFSVYAHCETKYTIVSFEVFPKFSIILSHENDNIAFDIISELWWSDYTREKNIKNPVPVAICPPRVSYEKS
jgi:hypothetical protein